jgi:hypothetical protein
VDKKPHGLRAHPTVLIHPGVGKQQRGIVGGDDRTAGHEGMALLPEEVDEALPNFLGRLHGFVTFQLFLTTTTTRHSV